MRVFTLSFFALVASVSASAQSIPYKVIKPGTFIYKSARPPMEAISPLSVGDTLYLASRISSKFHHVSFKGTTGYVIRENVEEIIPDFPVNQETKKIDFTGVIEIAGATKDQLYVRAKQWFATTFKSANAVIQMDDKAEGVIIGKGNYSETLVTKAMIGSNYTSQTHGFTVKVFLKDGKYKYSITDITRYIPPSQYTKAIDAPIENIVFSEKDIAYVRNTRVILLKTAKALEENLKATMQKPSSIEKDW